MSESHSIETWKPVVGWEGIYSVSDQGRVRRDKPGKRHPKFGHCLIDHPDGGGYRFVILYESPRKKISKVAHLVIEAFKGPRPAGLQVNHIDGNLRNNCASNLEYVTPKENIRHAVDVLHSNIGGRGVSRNRGVNHQLAKLNPEMVREMRILRASGWQYKDLGARFNVTRRTASRACKGELWGHVS